MRLGILLLVVGVLGITAIIVGVILIFVGDIPPVGAIVRLIFGGIAALWCLMYGIARVQRARAERLVKKVLGDGWVIKDHVDEG